MKAAREIGEKAISEAMAKVDTEIESLKTSAKSKEDEAIASVIAELV